MMGLREVADGYGCLTDNHERLFPMRDANGRVCLAVKNSCGGCRILATFTVDDEWDARRIENESSTQKFAREICDAFNERAAQAERMAVQS